MLLFHFHNILSSVPTTLIRTQAKCLNIIAIILHKQKLHRNPGHMRTTSKTFKIFSKRLTQGNRHPVANPQIELPTWLMGAVTRPRRSDALKI